MKRILGSILVVGVCLTPLTVPLMVQPSWGQTQNSQDQQVDQLLEQGRQQALQGQPLKSIETFQNALAISRQLNDRKLEALTLVWLGYNYGNIGQPQTALEYYSLALPICQEVDDRAGLAITLNNIGAVYYTIGQPQTALEYYNQALTIRTELDDRAGLATTLHNIGLVYRDSKQPTEAIEKLTEAMNITLEMRGDLKLENRQTFLQSKAGRAVALVDLLIDQNQPDKAYEWLNRAITAELADYTLLINAKVENPEAQKAIDEWNQENQQLLFLRQQLQQNFSDERSQQMRELEAQVNKKAEDISRDFPEAAELFETKPADIEQLKQNILPGTVIVHPVLLTGIRNVPNSIAIFVLTKDWLTVTKKPINPDELKLLTQYRQQLKNRFDTNTCTTSQKLYDILIRPVEGEIKTLSPSQLSIIASGILRYFPFETLYDSQTDQYLIQKYPVNYLTHISLHSWQNRSQTQLIAFLRSFGLIQNLAVFVIIGGIGFWVFRKFGSVAAGILIGVSGGIGFWLAFSRTPQVLAIAIKGSEEEVQGITKILPGSELYIDEKATLDTFKTQAPRFRFLHLATHCCFQLERCEYLDIEANTILFADKQYNIADAALLGLQNTELLTLNACQTDEEAVSDGQTISGVAYVFERAGAKAVIASMWNVEDKTTEEIMIQFYQNLKKGMSKSEALRQAKISQINSHPFFWSPLILIGDGR